MRKAVAATLAVLHNVSAGVIDSIVVATTRSCDVTTQASPSLTSESAVHVELCNHQGLLNCMPPLLLLLEIIMATNGVGETTNHVLAIYGQQMP